MKNKETKLEERYSVKSVSFKLEDIDESNRIVKGYFASFDTLDSDFDVIRKGAFNKSIQENGPNASGNRRIAHLRNHNVDRQIGFIKELFEDEKGLGFVSELSKSTEGNDALIDYQSGILREHSIGFNYIGDKMKFDESTEFSPNGHFDIFEVKLWEGSGVTFGANSLTPVIEAAKSSGDLLPLLKEIQELEEAFTIELKNGKGSDTKLQDIEIRFKQIQQLRDSLVFEKPSIKDTLINNQPDEKAIQQQQRKDLLLKLIKK
jgi:HK97 family phage prohead protease